jgi:pimeloyl-ACP methyl ester carboxylesterase
MTIAPFTIDVPDPVVEDLHRRLDATIWPQPIKGTGWDYGTDVDFLRDLCAYWRHQYDWRAQERALNAWPQYLVGVDDSAASGGDVAASGGDAAVSGGDGAETGGDGAETDDLDIHCIHVPGHGPDPLPLVLTHGWPSSFFEMHKVIGPLSDPAAHGGDPADAFHVVVPSLPGYGFSSQPQNRGMNAGRVAGLWVKLMARLGYDRFGAHGGDWGSAVGTALGAGYPDRIIGIHLTMLAPPVDEATLTPEERVWWEPLKAYRDAEWGYVHLQRTKPQTASFALTDSPAGLAAWITEKWWRWSDCADEAGVRDLWRSYSREEVLTNLMIYWSTQTIGSSMRMYFETFSAGSTIVQPPRITVPTGVAVFNEINRPPRRLAEPHYDIRRWTVIDQGGHFPALENPDALVSELREFFRPLRPLPQSRRPHG